eukprot:gene14653-14777_t
MIIVENNADLSNYTAFSSLNDYAFKDIAPLNIVNDNIKAASPKLKINLNSDRRKKAPAALKICSADDIVRAFNTWAYKREQPSDVNLMAGLVAQAIALNEPVPFLCYWGKGPRNSLAFPDVTCMDFLRGLSSRIQQIYAPGVDIKLIFTDTHARLNGHDESNLQNYFRAVRDHASELGFSTTLLSEVVTQAGETAHDELHLDPLRPEMLGKLSEMALKWYRGAGSIEQGAAEYFAMNMIEKRAIELAYPRSIFMTFNGSEFRNLFPKSLPVFYMYSLRRGVSVKPWFVDGDASAVQAVAAE